MSGQILGIHHVTSIGGDPQRNVDFYCGVLGLRLVKQTVNFDMPETYHLYYGDEVGTPGTILTIFPWGRRPRARPGTGQITVTAFSIPGQSVGYWVDRLKRHSVPLDGPHARDDEEVITFSDPDGLRYELVAQEDAPQRRYWKDSPVPAEHAIRGFFGVTISVSGVERTAAVLTDLLGFEKVVAGDDRARYRIGEGDSRAMIDLVNRPAEPRGQEGVGTVHHIAWRTPNDTEQLAWRERIAAAGLNVTTVRDRQYFRSIYFREPGGVLFEIATDPPGFTLDEPVEELGTQLKLPPWIEPRRARIEQVLPPLRLPQRFVPEM